MKFSVLSRIMPKYVSCPICGNDRIGNENGKLIIEEEYFYRECSCGWNITIDKEGNVSKESY